jgi:hypothetical protein
MGEYPHIVTLEEQLVKAISSMELQTYMMAFSIRVYTHKMEENRRIKLFLKAGD